MVRFIDLRGQEIHSRFAFWNTVTDKFFEFNSNQAWDDFKDFAEDFWAPTDYYEKLERFKRLMPKWAFEKEEDKNEI